MIRKDIRILDEKEIKQRLKELSGWDYKEGKISKEFKFKEFMDVHATAMEMSGFMQEAGNLRRWTAELARKSTDAEFSRSRPEA